MLSVTLPFVPMFLFFSPVQHCDHLAWEKRELVSMLIVHLFILILKALISVLYIFLLVSAACDCNTLNFYITFFPGTRNLVLTNSYLVDSSIGFSAIQGGEKNGITFLTML